MSNFKDKLCTHAHTEKCRKLARATEVSVTPKQSIYFRNSSTGPDFDGKKILTLIP